MVHINVSFWRSSHKPFFFKQLTKTFLADGGRTNISFWRTHFYYWRIHTSSFYWRRSHKYFFFSCRSSHKHFFLKEFTQIFLPEGNHTHIFFLKTFTQTFLFTELVHTNIFSLRNSPGAFYWRISHKCFFLTEGIHINVSFWRSITSWSNSHKLYFLTKFTQTFYTEGDHTQTFYTEGDQTQTC